MADIYCVGVAGSGTMGAGVAEVAARAGHDVVLCSRSRQSGAQAVAGIAAGFERQIAKGRLGADERDEILARISVTDAIIDLADCDLVIENVVEDMETKRALFAALDAAVKPSAILATNTSTLPVVELAMSTTRPGQVCGIHFFNPAPTMRLVEIVRPPTASATTIDRAVAFAERCGKEPITVADHAGFVVNALLFPYLNNAVKMFERGTATIESIDAAMCGGCGFPMGPFALLDLIGLDTSVAILDTLHAEFGDANYVPAPTLRRMVGAGRLGRKTGSGFHRY
jgi:3-hydroxybutyryl-CoA dehydrogenase